MAFVHVATHRIFVTPVTCQPDAGWMKSQAVAFLSYTEQEQLGCDILIRDLDGKYSSDFDRYFTDRGITVKPVGPRTPNLNAFIERWIQSLKHEALNHFVVFGLEHFEYIVSKYVSYYHECRSHQEIGNRLIGDEENEQPPDVTSIDQVRCEKRLGGLLKHYYRPA